MKSENRIKLAVQMFNFVPGGDWAQIQDQAAAEALLTEFAAAGYDGVEWCNFQLNEPWLDLFSLKQKMDALGLQTCGLHFHYNGAESLDEDCRTAIERCRILGCDKVIFAFSLPSTFGIEPDADGNYTPEQIDAWAREIDHVLETLRQAATNAVPEQPSAAPLAISERSTLDMQQDIAANTLSVSDLSVRILYHNHNTELLKGSDGRYLLDMIHPDGQELDVYWVAKGLDGRVSSALDYVRAHDNTVQLLHVKDGLNGSKVTGEMCGWGNGTYPLQEIVDCAKELGLSWVVAENDAPQNFSISGLTDAIQSATYAREKMNFEV